MAKRLVSALAALTIVVSGVIAQDGGKPGVQEDAATLKVGDEAPQWQLEGSDGKIYKLSDYKGKKAVVVAWYPAALTGG